jgi:hypothetical protein
MLYFTISLPTDEGYLGRECKNPDCHRYFRIHSDDVQEQMFCPYCGQQFPKKEFLTTEQRDHVRKVAKEKATKYAHDEINKMLLVAAHKTL